MVRPQRFIPNPETAADNAFQSLPELARDEIARAAHDEVTHAARCAVRHLTDCLRVGVLVQKDRQRLGQAHEQLLAQGHLPPAEVDGKVDDATRRIHLPRRANADADNPIFVSCQQRGNTSGDPVDDRIGAFGGQRR